MSRLLILIYGLLAYLIGMCGLAVFILFVGGWEILPFHIDSGEPGPIGMALLVNTGLMVMLGVQHSVMARSGFKKALTKVIHPAAERSTYVLISGVVFVTLCYFWQTLSGTLWHVENSLARVALTTIQLLGWVLVLVSSFEINHFELFGLQQVYHHFVGRSASPAHFTERFLYKFVRHPLQLGVLIGIWVTPTMTMTHLMLSVLMTIYVFIGLHFEEKDLVAVLGPDYENYQKRVRMIVPLPKRPQGND